MGLRFRKSIKLAPGIRMNLSGGGVSWSVGSRGASVNIGKRGSYLNAGIPGTGISSRHRLDKPRQRETGENGKTITLGATVRVEDDGTILFLDAQGNPLSEKMIRLAKKQQGEIIKQTIQKQCDEINAQVDALGEIHFYTPSPSVPPKYEKRDFVGEYIVTPKLKKTGILGFLWGGYKKRIEAENAVKISAYQYLLDQQAAEKSQFDKSEMERRQLVEEKIYRDEDAMEKYLELCLQEITWPRETLISCEMRGDTAWIDVDLPEIEDIPSKYASMPQTGYKLNVRDISDTKRQTLYMTHVHAVGFRIAGEAFASLPTCKKVVISAFSQRHDSKTGKLGDEYLYSAVIDREIWQRIDFCALNKIDVVAAMAQFNLRREMTKTGRFKAIQPFMIEDTP